MTVYVCMCTCGCVCVCVDADALLGKAGQGLGSVCS